MKKMFLMAVGVCAMGIGLMACSSGQQAGYGAGYGNGYGYQGGYQGGYQNNAMAALPAQTQYAIMSDMQQNPGLYQQQPNETYNAYQSRIGNYATRWMTPEQLRNQEYRYAVSSAAIQQATSMGLTQAKAENMMWDEAVKAERAQANIWDARADAQYSKRRINNDKTGAYKDTTQNISGTVGGISDTFRNTSQAIDNFKSIFH